MSPLSENSKATLWVLGKWDSIIRMIEVIGTARNIPNTPQVIPQNDKLSITINGLRLSLRPITLGST